MNFMKILRCPMCGGTLKTDESQNCYICEFCETPQTISNINDEKIISLKERANKLFLSCDFDGAAALYQAVVSEINDDAESYWMLALCTYGIQYVDDPRTGKKIPTCHRTLYSSILNNEDYLNAIECADVIARDAYKDAAEKIDEIQRGILSIVSKEDAYDVFICYKETASDGSHTRESDIAKDLYYKLTAEGYRTFYAPITLQEKAGFEYEPFIFAALNSAKIMFVIGFSREHYDAVWVKNEWSRYLARKAKNPRLLLISCYNSYLMDASQLPEQLNKTQARDLSNASTNDLVNDVKKWLPKKETEPTKVANIDVTNIMGGNAVSLLKRGYIYLEDGEFKEAIDCFNKSLDLNPELSKAYWGLVLAKLNCRNNDSVIKLGKPIHDSNECKKAVRFANVTEKNEYQTVIDGISKKIDSTKKALTTSRTEKIIATGICEEIKNCETEISAMEEEYNRLISSLKGIEENIIMCVEDCKKVADPFYKRATAALDNARKFSGKISKSNKMSDEDKDEINKIIEESKVEINSAVFNALEKAKKENACFKTLSELLVQQKSTVNALDTLSSKINAKISKLEAFGRRMKEIESEYAPAFSQVPTGDYRLSSKLLG